MSVRTVAGQVHAECLDCPWRIDQAEQVELERARQLARMHSGAQPAHHVRLNFWQEREYGPAPRGEL